jgi:hypothetical protein
VIIFPAIVALSFMILWSSAYAKDQKPVNTGANSKGISALQKGLGAMIASAMPPGQTNRKVDPDQGDDHASDRAIQVVCSKDTPAARRSAICPTGPISP